MGHAGSEYSGGGSGSAGRCAGTPINLCNKSEACEDIGGIRYTNDEVVASAEVVASTAVLLDEDEVDETIDVAEMMEEDDVVVATEEVDEVVAAGGMVEEVVAGGMVEDGVSEELP